MGMIINPYAFGGGAAVLGSISYIGNNKAGASPSFSFPTAAIGAADATRRLLIVIATSNSVAFRTVTAFTVNGVGATFLGAVNSSGFNGGRLEIWNILVPTGTTANLAGTFNGTNAQHTIHVFRIINETSGSIATVGAATAGATISTTIPVSAGGWVAGVANAFGASTSPTNCTFTGATQDINDVLGTTVIRCNAAHDNNLPANAARPVSSTNVGSSSSQIGDAVWMSGI